MKQKKIYQQPETTVTRVELESPICNGSVNYVGEEGNKSVNIKSQDVVETDKNDFSNDSWGEFSNNN